MKRTLKNAAYVRAFFYWCETLKPMRMVKVSVVGQSLLKRIFLSNVDGHSQVFIHFRRFPMSQSLQIATATFQFLLCPTTFMCESRC